MVHRPLGTRRRTITTAVASFSSRNVFYHHVSTIFSTWRQGYDRRAWERLRRVCRHVFSLCNDCGCDWYACLHIEYAVFNRHICLYMPFIIYTVYIRIYTHLKDMRVANRACNMTTAVALEQNTYREFLGISGVNVRMYSSTRDSCHVCGRLLRTLIMPKNTMIITIFRLYFTMSTSFIWALPVVDIRILKECH